MIHTSKKKKNLEKKLLGPRGRTSKRKEIENRIERISEGKFKKKPINGKLLFCKFSVLTASTTGVGLNIDFLVFKWFIMVF